MGTMTVKDSAGVTQTVAKVANTGQTAAANSLPVVTSDEDKVLLGVKVTSVTALESGGTGIIGWLSQVWRETAALLAKLPATLGSKADAASLSVTLATEDKSLLGTKVTAVTALAAGGTGVIGWLSQIWDVLQSRLPTALGSNGGIKAEIVAGAANLAAAATGGYTPGSLRSAASNNATNIKASAGTLGFLTAINTTATVYYLKLYNKASAPAPATDNGLLVGVYPIPASTSGAGIAIPIPTQGLNFSTGISFAIVAGISDTDNTNAATGVCVNYGYA